MLPKDLALGQTQLRFIEGRAYAKWGRVGKTAFVDANGFPKAWKYAESNNNYTLAEVDNDSPCSPVQYNT